ncbi:MAG: hypothetical protein LBM04_06825 [Opitutaceae bacterium]|jgi:hypothetical protein|nr:hypothetical protein [Opitutaceae bacterium]
MTPELEKLIALYSLLKEATPLQNDTRLEAWRQACNLHAGRFGMEVGQVMTFVRKAYYKNLAADNKRAGRPPDIEA